MTVTTPARPLAPYAFDEADSQGRRHPEPEHPYRRPYQRDRDRVIHSKAFRRLENKTQVFGPDYSDHFRNRLTHTLEVSQIARTISDALSLNTDLCEALALSHDIGHPPFSHEGESVLDALMKEHGSGFDHNLHALVIVEDFESRYASFRGLNLTFEVREGIVKHSRDYDGSERLPVDVSEYRPGERPPLEAQLVDLADEIAYNAADLDDGLESGLLGLDQSLEESQLLREIFSLVGERFPDAPPKLRRREAVRRLIDRLVTALIDATRERIEGLNIDSPLKVRRHPERLVAFDLETRRHNHEIKRLLRRRLYHHPVLRGARRDARKMVEALFRHYLHDPSRLPPGYRRRMESEDTSAHVLICHYIAGMTDTYAQGIFKSLS